jgi:hypothetical protein
MMSSVTTRSYENIQDIVAELFAIRDGVCR